MSLDWPAGWDRTPTRDRSPNRNYEVSLSKAFDDLEAELGRLGVDDYRYSFDANQRQRDQRPYARASPDDPSFVVRWTMDGEQFAVGCDAHSRLRDNVRTAGLYIREKRKMEQRPVTTGETEFSNLRLPAGDEPVAGEPPAHVVLGVEPDADAEVVRAAFRAKVKETHPDSEGGDQEAFKRVKDAREVMLDE